MELRQLTSFVTIAKLGSTTQAANVLGYAQSSITTQMQLLEGELGTKLFERLGRSLNLSSDGLKLLPYAQQILHLTHEAQQVMAVGETVKGTLTIGAVESLCVKRLPELVKEFRQRYPAVELVLRLGNCIDFPQLLTDNVIDVAFSLGQRNITSYLISELNCEEPMVLLAAPGHPLVGKVAVYPQDFAGEPLILTEDTCPYRKVFEAILNEAGIQPYSVLETGSLQAIKQFAMSGLGITLLPGIAVTEELAAGRLVKLPWGGPDFGMKTQVIYHKDKWLSPPIRALLDLAEEMLRKS